MYTKPSLLPITQSIQDVKASLPPKLQAPFMTALRAFTLSWSLSTLPGVVSVLVKFCLALLQHKPNKISLVRRLLFNQLPKLLKNSIYQNGFPWLVTGAIGSHRFVRYLLEQWSLSLRHYQLLGDQVKKGNSNSNSNSNKNDTQSEASNGGGDGDSGNKRLTLFVSVVATMYLVKRLFPTSRTSELTSFTLFRAMDVYAHRAYLSPLVARLVPAWTLKYGSVIAFTLFCTEIMFSWFYVPSRLPRGYALWITKVAQMDERLILFLRAVRNGTFVYGKDTGVDDLLCNYCVDIGMPFESGLSTRGRVPCRLVHNGQPWGCEVNALTQFVKVVTKVFLLYFTVHLTPSLLFKRNKLIQNPLSSALHILGASARSSTFLATYTSSIWYAVCLTRTRIGHQLLGLDQTRLDTLGPFIGSAICGLSLIIESPHRRGEMALYVAPRALFSFMERLVNPWYYHGRWWEPKVAEAFEALVFAASTTTVLTAMYTDKDMVRSSVRGILGWIMKYELEQEKAGK
ncbi:hypothetical protein [Absidia glauca]|uniref:Transmembrane protein 135 N-terminal domain-containing protein n=1 Tax=Absidia glauca TaxID=4829 RepID=A0A163JZA1_ABSGL|nr:hypothetical protein [Absidia glauca]